MNPWFALVFVGLATAAIVDSTKLLPRRIKPHHKMVLALVAAGCLTTLVTRTSSPWRTSVAISLGGWGLSRLVHSVTSMLQAHKDHDRLDVVKAAQRR